jgi:hypothetical protein
MTTMQVEGDWKIKVRGMEPHPIPHAHVESRDGFRCSVSLQDFKLLAGGVRPNKRLGPALEWIKEHRDELLAEYERLNRK